MRGMEGGNDGVEERLDEYIGKALYWSMTKEHRQGRKCYDVVMSPFVFRRGEECPQ